MLGRGAVFCLIDCDASAGNWSRGGGGPLVLYNDMLGSSVVSNWLRLATLNSWGIHESLANYQLNTLILMGEKRR